MGWRAWDKYESEAHERWKALPWRKRFSLRTLLTLALLVAFVAGFVYSTMARGASTASAEHVCVKYGPCPLDLASFKCTETSRSSFVRRVCYESSKQFVAIQLNDAWYPYCAVPAGAVNALLSAPSIGRHYNENFRSKRDGTHGPYDCRDNPMPKFS